MLKKSQVLKEGYFKGLKAALNVIRQQLNETPIITDDHITSGKNRMARRRQHFKYDQATAEKNYKQIWKELENNDKFKYAMAKECARILSNPKNYDIDITVGFSSGWLFVQHEVTIHETDYRYKNTPYDIKIETGVCPGEEFPDRAREEIMETDNVARIDRISRSVVGMLGYEDLCEFLSNDYSREIIHFFILKSMNDHKMFGTSGNKTGEYEMTPKERDRYYELLDAFDVLDVE